MSGFEDDAEEFETRLRHIRRVCLESRREGVTVEGDPEEFLAIIAAVLEYQKRFRLALDRIGTAATDAAIALDEIGRILKGNETAGDPT